MPTYQKVLIVLGVILLFGSIMFIVYTQNQISKRQTAIETQVVAQKKLSDDIVRSQSSYATQKDIEQFIKDQKVDLKPIQDDLKKLHAEIATVNVTTVISKPQYITNVPSTNVGPDNPNPVNPVCPDGTICPNADPYEYGKAQQNIALSEDFGKDKVPIGSVGFSTFKEKPWSLDIKGREYSVTNVVGTDENQRQYFYNKFTVTVDGKVYAVPITKAELKQEYPEAKFSWWNPRLRVGVDGGISLNDMKGQFTPSANISFMSYGKFKPVPDITVLEIGVGYATPAQKPQVIFTPFSYNVGKHLPLMNNLYVAPSIQFGANGFSVMAGIRVGL